VSEVWLQPDMQFSMVKAVLKDGAVMQLRGREQTPNHPSPRPAGDARHPWSAGRRASRSAAALRGSALVRARPKMTRAFDVLGAPSTLTPCGLY